MPIQSHMALKVLCDLCHLPLAIPLPPPSPSPLLPFLFHSTQDAGQAAQQAGWKVGYHFLLCPLCAAIQPPTRQDT